MNYYTIKMTKETKDDLKLIKNYLKDNLQEPIIANKMMEKLKESIKSLSNFPERFPIVKDYYLSLRNLRKYIVDNYIIFYTVEKDKKIVHIIRIIYGKINWL